MTTIRRFMVEGQYLQMMIAVMTVVVVAWSQPADSTHSAKTNLLAMFSLTDSTLLGQAVSAYKFQQSEVVFSYAQASKSIALKSLLDNKSDFVTASVPPTEANLGLRTDINVLPAVACAYVAVYRISSLSSAIPLILSRDTLARIFRGNITMWNDPAIVSLNRMQGMPAMNITVVLPAVGSGTTYVLTNALNKFDSTFAQQVGIDTSYPIWPTSKFSKMVQADGIMSIQDAVIATQGSIGFVPLALAKQYSLTFASLVNKAGNVIVASTTSVNYALVELGSSSETSSTSRVIAYDLHDAQGQAAYSIVAMSYLLISSTVTRTTCDVRAQVIKFWLWFYQSAAVKQIALNLGFATLPDVIMDERAVLSVLGSQMQCDGAYLSVEQGQKTTLRTVGSDYIGDVMDMIVAFYSDQDADNTYTFSTTSSRSSFLQISKSEIDAALVVPSFLTEAEREDSSDELAFVPSFLGRVTPVFKFPKTVNTTSQQDHQLVLSLEALYGIFTGQIASWLDPFIVATNPDLKQRWGSSDPTIRVILTQPASDQYSEPVADAFVSSLATALNVSVKLPYDWTQWTQQTAFKGRYYFAEDAKQVESMVLNMPGSIGYKLSRTSIADRENDVSISQFGQVVDSGVDNLLPCLSSTFNAEQQIIKTERSEDGKCWPLYSVISFIVRKTYSGTTVCKRANATLGMIKWFQTEATLSEALQAIGIMPISTYAPAFAYNIAKLNSITCDGENLLITYPVLWSLNNGIRMFAYVLSAIGLVACVAVMVLLILHRQKTVFKSASAVFLGTTLLGVMVLFAGGVLMGSTPSHAACGGMAWTVSLGFTLAFGPIFAKSWRIYRIFGRKALKVVKISNRHLGLGVFGLLVVEAVVLSIWQADSPMSPITTSVLQGTKFHEYTQCSVEEAGVKYLAILIAIKAALLVFGSMMAFSTRRVATTFNESQSIAWAIYNVIFSVCIIVPISVFTAARGDALVLLMVFLQLWIAYFTMGIMFFPKLLQVFKPDDVYGFSENSSMRESSGGFSFLSASMMSKEILTKYINALEAQLKSAKQRLASFGGAVQNLVSATGAAASKLGQTSFNGGGGGVRKNSTDAQSQPKRKLSVSTDDDNDKNKGEANRISQSSSQRPLQFGANSVSSSPVQQRKSSATLTGGAFALANGNAPGSSSVVGGMTASSTGLMRRFPSANSPPAVIASPSGASAQSQQAVPPGASSRAGGASTSVAAAAKLNQSSANPKHTTGFDELYHMTYPVRASSPTQARTVPSTTAVSVRPSVASTPISLATQEYTFIPSQVAASMRASAAANAANAANARPKTPPHAGDSPPSSSQTMTNPLLGSDTTISTPHHHASSSVS